MIIRIYYDYIWANQLSFTILKESEVLLDICEITGMLLLLLLILYHYWYGVLSDNLSFLRPDETPSLLEILENSSVHNVVAYVGVCVATYKLYFVGLRCLIQPTCRMWCPWKLIRVLSLFEIWVLPCFGMLKKGVHRWTSSCLTMNYHLLYTVTCYITIIIYYYYLNCIMNQMSK